jgi:hypothetical protein
MKTKGYAVRLPWRRASRFALIAPVAVVLSLATVVAGIAQSHAPVFPDLIQLPADFGPEGIAVGNGHTFYVGSLAPETFGQILVGDLRTGTFSELVPPPPSGRMAAGMKFDSRSSYLHVAGGPSGRATVYDTNTGAEIAFYQFLPPGVPGINDVVLTREAAYFNRHHSAVSRPRAPRAAGRAWERRADSATG